MKSSARTLDSVIVLAIDTATPAVTAGVVRVDAGNLETLATRVTVDARAHGELLTPHITAVLGAAGIGFDQVDAIVCGTGPGPFTGLRVGMVTASALGHGLGRPVHGVCTLDAIAADVDDADDFLVVTDARRREVYWARYEHGKRTEGPEVGPPAGLRGTAAAGHAAELAGLSVLEPAYPSPHGLVRAAQLDQEPAEFRPLYLRRPDAVEPGARKKVSKKVSKKVTV